MNLPDRARELISKITQGNSSYETWVANICSMLEQYKEDFLNEQWHPANKPPELGGEYITVWDLGDNDEPVTASMEWDAINKRWIDTRDSSGTDRTKEVLFWQDMPLIPKELKSDE